jgi:hypothetical protein
MDRISLKAKWFVVGIIFVICVAPTFISYEPYSFNWDDAVYLQQAIAVSRAFWAGSADGIDRLREIRFAMDGIRPPAMTLLGLPWGPARSWDVAGNCFVTLACWISTVSALCLFLLARIGVKPRFLILACVCVCAALGPIPANSFAHYQAAALLADSLFAWTCLAALLLIPHESRTGEQSPRHALLRGILWGLVLSLGTMTKISFLYFVVLILLVLMWIRYRRGGLRSCWPVLAGFLISSAPSAAYLVRYGHSSFANGGASSFGTLSKLYELSLLPFVADSVRSSPGLGIFGFGVLIAFAYLFFQRRSRIFGPDVVALLIAVGFGLIVLASPNRQIRYSFPLIVSLPFLLAILLSSRGEAVPRRAAAVVSGLALLVLLAAGFPSRYRTARHDSLARADAVLAQASRCGDNTLFMATDSPTLNYPLLHLGVDLSGSTTQIRALYWSAFAGSPISEDYRMIRESDLVVFQDDRALSPPFTNLRVPDYRQYISQQSELKPTRIGDDLSAFSRHCK